MIWQKHFNILYFFLSIIWALVIYYFSSLPDLKSGLDSTLDLILRKGAHIFVYSILSYCLLKIFDKDEKHYLLFAIVVSVFYAGSDELHQLSVSGRYGSPVDIAFDSGGVFLGVIFYRLFKKSK